MVKIPYQQWCNHNRLKICSIYNISIFLGLNTSCNYFDGRKYYTVSERYEINKRIEDLMEENICYYDQNGEYRV